MRHKCLLDELGGHEPLRAIVDRFVDRECDDAMIGFFFQKVDRERLKQREYEFAARHLGGDVPYTGRPIDVAHAPHPIMGGQFMRRVQILRETLEEAGVPERVREHWIEHTMSLMPLVTSDRASECDPEAAREHVEDAKRFRRSKKEDEA